MDESLGAPAELALLKHAAPPRKIYLITSRFSSDGSDRTIIAMCL